MKAAALARETAGAFRKARLHFGHGTANARDEAAWLVGHVLGIHPGEVHFHPKTASRAEIARARSIARRRIRERVPLAYLLMEAWLDGRTFHVDRRVIVPRSYLSELLREKLRPWLRRPARRALDLGTGSGCLAILAALAFPRARVDASDVSAAALQVARINVRNYRLASRVRLIRSDLFSALQGRRYDLILSNPPYVEERTMRRLPREYCHEPRRSLAAGRDGLDLVRRILQQAASHLTPRGLLVCEVGDARRSLERAYPDVPFLWPGTSDPHGCVFVLGREELGPLSRSPGRPAAAGIAES